MLRGTSGRSSSELWYTWTRWHMSALHEATHFLVWLIWVCLTTAWDLSRQWPSTSRHQSKMFLTILQFCHILLGQILRHTMCHTTTLQTISWHDLAFLDSAPLGITLWAGLSLCVIIKQRVKYYLLNLWLLQSSVISRNVLPQESSAILFIYSYPVTYMSHMTLYLFGISVSADGRLWARMIFNVHIYSKLLALPARVQGVW